MLMPLDDTGDGGDEGTTLLAFAVSWPFLQGYLHESEREHLTFIYHQPRIDS